MRFDLRGSGCSGPSRPPTTAIVLVRNEAPDWTRVARLVTEKLPDDAFVVYGDAEVPVRMLTDRLRR